MACVTFFFRRMVAAATLMHPLADGHAPIWQTLDHQRVCPEFPMRSWSRVNNVNQHLPFRRGEFFVAMFIYSMSRSRNSKAALRARTHSKVWYLMQRGSEVVILRSCQSRKNRIMLLFKLCQRHTYCQRWLSSWGHVDSNIATNERRSAPSCQKNPQTNNNTIQIHSNTTYQPFRY